MIVKFLAIVLTDLAMIAPGAHLFELIRKMRLPEDQYYVVQQIYLGWWIAGLLLPAALIANMEMAVRLTARPRAGLPAPPRRSSPSTSLYLRSGRNR